MAETGKKTKRNLDNSLKLLAKTSIIVLAGLIFSKLFTYVYRIIVARYFGPEVYGLFSLALMISGWFIIVASLGLTEGLIRFIPLYRGKNQNRKINYLFRFVFYSSLVFGIISGTLLFFLSETIAVNLFNNSQLIIFLKIFAFLIPLTLLTTPFLVILRAHEKIGAYSFLSNIFQSLSKVVVLIILIFLGFNVHSVAYSYVIGVFLLLVAAYLFCKHLLPGIFLKNLIKDRERKNIRRELFAYSMPLLFSGAVFSLFYWIDSFSLGIYKSAYEVGLYNAAVPIAMLLGMFPEIFMQLFFPMINREYSKKNNKLIEQLSKQVTKWIFIICLPIFTLVFLFPGAALNLLFGSDYLPAEIALRILLIGSLISALSSVSQQLITMIGKSKLVLMNITIASLLNLLLNTLLVPQKNLLGLDNSSGMIGAAMATVISMLFLNILFQFQNFRYLHFIPIRRKVIRIVISAAVSSLLIFFLKSFIVLNIFSIILLSLLFFISYALIIFISRAFDENDISIVHSIIKKRSLIKKYEN